MNSSIQESILEGINTFCWDFWVFLMSSRMRPDYNYLFFGPTSAHIWKTNSTFKGRGFAEALSKLLPGLAEKWQPSGLVPSLCRGSFCNNEVGSISEATALQCTLFFFLPFRTVLLKNVTKCDSSHLHEVMKKVSLVNLLFENQNTFISSYNC